MEKRLKNLRNTMEQNVFQNAQFTQKERIAIHAKTQQKKQASWMPRIAFSLSVLILIILSTTFSQDEHTANYRITENDLDGQFFQSERAGEHHSTFYFYDGEMGVIPQNPLILDPEEVDESIHAEERLNKKIYPNISVKTEGTSYFVYSNNELIVTFEKIAPRIVVDKNGNRYSTSLYLSKEYELQFVNQSSIDLSNLELAINDESYTIPKNKLSHGNSLSFNIPRNHNTFHKTIALDVTFDYKDSEGNKQHGKIAQPFSLDNSYSDYYTLVINGDSYDALTLTLQAAE